MLIAVAAALVGAQASRADDGGKQGGSEDVVFIQTNELDSNRIVVYDRADDGRLTSAGSYPTRGIGGAALPGTESDRLASQGSLVYDSGHRLLLAVNAGSDTISAFRVRGDKLRLGDVLPSGGQFPASIAVDDELMYVLNAGGTGIVQGFRIDKHGLEPISGSARSLGLANTDPPHFLTSPGQVGFTPDGGQLIVTTKASGSAIDVFHVGNDGRLSNTPVVNSSATPVPFAFTFDSAGRLVMGEAGASSVTPYQIATSGTLAIRSRRRTTRSRCAGSSPFTASTTSRTQGATRSVPIGLVLTANLPWSRRRGSSRARIQARSTSHPATVSSMRRPDRRAPWMSSAYGVTGLSLLWGRWSTCRPGSRASPRRSN
jgi:DNA-binding beta-propeller fold protein YncE